MRLPTIIESRCWTNTMTGQTASIYGAVPYTNEADKANWTVIQRGFTFQHPDGTVGNGRQPFKTKVEAETALAKIIEYRKEYDKLLKSQSK